MIRKLLTGMLVLIPVLTGFAIFGILIPGGTFKNINPHFDGTTEIIPIEISGPEDIEIDRHDGLVFISVNDRRHSGKTGGILVYNTVEGIESIVNRTPSGLTDFHPHGISLFRSNDSTLYLFAINHQQSGRQVVERFIWDYDSLIHIESIEDKMVMTSPNDLVATGDRTFYVTNDHYYLDGTPRVLEEYLQRAISFVNFYDGKTFRTVAEGIGYANGINQSPDGKYIFVAACTGRSIYVYEKDKSGLLTKVDEMKLDTAPDNIHFDEQGNLLIGCHPQLLKFVAHAKDAKKFSPSQVLKIQYGGINNFRVEEIFLNDGSDYSGSSIAVSYENKLIIGSVFEPAILVCQFN